MQELLAKALGASSWGELKTKLPKGLALKPTSAVALKDVRCAADLDPQNLRALVNDDGWLDLVALGEEGELVSGLFEALDGTLEDIKACLANGVGSHRSADGEIAIDYQGETDVNWDGQVTCVGENGRAVWLTRGSDEVNEVDCSMAPVSFDPDEPEGALIREALVDIYERIVRENSNCGVAATLAESSSPREGRKTLRWIAEKLRFALHEAEAQALFERLSGSKALF